MHSIFGSSRSSLSLAIAFSAALGTSVNPWERAVGHSFENRGIAQVERVGSRWLLNVMCGATHATYVDETTKIDLARFADDFVTARYHYVDRTIDVNCFRAPCPPSHERRVVIERLTRVTKSPQHAAQLARQCAPPKIE